MKYQRSLIIMISAFVAATAAADGEYPVSLECTRAAEETIIDGYFTDATWTDANWQSDFRQSEPTYGEPSTERTSVAFAFDDRNIYIAVRCDDSRPDLIRATKLRHRDNPADDDNVQIVFDTYLDQIRGAVFLINPLGAKEEAQVNGYRNYNWNWNEVWEAAAALTADGWQAEFRIPLRVLRFSSNDSQEWGVNVQRVIQRKHELVYLVPPPPPFDISSLNYAAKLTGLRLNRQDHNFQMLPYLLAGSVFELDEDTGVSETGTINDIGFDMKYSLSSDLTLDATYNTDFAQVESDEEQVNLTRFSLFFPEKREFFLENAQLFSFGALGGRGMYGGGLAPFFSRRIGLDEDGGVVPIDFGLRVTGKVWRQDVGVLSVRAAAVGELELDSGFYNVARVRRSIVGRSYVGGIVTDSRRGGFHSSTLGVDGQWFLTPEMSVNGYFLTNAGDRSIDDDEGSEVTEGGRNALQARIDYTTDPFGFRFQWDDVGENFDPDLGFVNRDGYRKGGLALRRSIRPNRWGIRRISARLFYDWYTSRVAEVMESSSFYIRNEVNFESGDQLDLNFSKNFERLFVPFELDEDVLIFDAGDYDFISGEISFRTDNSRRWGINTNFSFGEFYDGDMQELRGGFFYVLNKHFRIGGSLSNYKIDSNHGGINWHLWRIRLNHIHNSHLSASTYFQYNSSNGSAVLNLRLRLIHSNDSDLFIVFNERRVREGGVWELYGRESVVKANYRLFL
ncbi:MAG TPA: DUF5916 domain-containing protein [Acidobacteriota bacterium]|nr:DUF5916 domain-containing protein [Acidobacteriota bacterium]